MKWKTILASASPRRSELLRQVGIDFEICVSDADDAYRMLTAIQNSQLRVFTGVSVFTKLEQEEPLITFAEKTIVELYPMTEAQIQAFIASGEPMDKAGSYCIQGSSAIYTKCVDGDYYNVIGLPIARLYQELMEKGYDLKKPGQL